MRPNRKVYAALLITISAWAEPNTLELDINADHFTVNGRARFLVFISYFDAMRASADTLEKDFEYLRSNGFDGIRIFPNWWDFRSEIQFGADTLMDGKGQLRPDRLAALKNLLGLAARYNLLVDVSFAYETVEGLSDLRRDQVGTSQGALPVNQVHLKDYMLGLTRLARELSAYRNAFFDIQNEFNGRVTHLSDDEIRSLRTAIKKGDPDRLVTASLANEIGPEDVAKRSNDVSVDIVAWHESRNPWRYDAMDSRVEQAKHFTTKPVYLGEPAILEGDLSVENFVVAIAKAKAGGAAAWTFHTQSGFDLSEKPLVDLLTDAEKKFVRSFRARLDATTWGAVPSAPAAK